MHDAVAILRVALTHDADDQRLLLAPPRDERFGHRAVPQELRLDEASEHARLPVGTGAAGGVLLEYLEQPVAIGRSGWGGIADTFSLGERDVADPALHGPPAGVAIDIEGDHWDAMHSRKVE